MIIGRSIGRVDGTVAELTDRRGQANFLTPATGAPMTIVNRRLSGRRGVGPPVATRSTSDRGLPSPAGRTDSTHRPRWLAIHNPKRGRRPTRADVGPARRPTLIAMRQILLRANVLLASWAIGLLVAAWIVPGVSLSVPGFIVALVVFAVTQAILSLAILTLPRRYVSLLLGGTGLALTIIALILASVLTHGLTIDGMASWLATTVVVWLVTTIGAITLPELLIRAGSGST